MISHLWCCDVQTLLLIIFWWRFDILPQKCDMSFGFHLISLLTMYHKDEIPRIAKILPNNERMYVIEWPLFVGFNAVLLPLNNHRPWYFFSMFNIHLFFCTLICPLLFQFLQSIFFLHFWLEHVVKIALIAVKCATFFRVTILKPQIYSGEKDIQSKKDISSLVIYFLAVRNRLKMGFNSSLKFSLEMLIKKCKNKVPTIIWLFYYETLFLVIFAHFLANWFFISMIWQAVSFFAPSQIEGVDCFFSPER